MPTSAQQRLSPRLPLLCGGGVLILLLLLLCCHGSPCAAEEAAAAACTNPAGCGSSHREDDASVRATATAVPSQQAKAKETTEEQRERDLIQKMKEIHMQKSKDKKESAPGQFQTNKMDSYESKKEELQCRACVGIADLFFNIYIPKVKEIYKEYLGDAKEGGAAAAAVPRAFPTGMRERIAADIHTNVDDLCLTLKKVYKRQEEKEEQARQKAGSSAAKTAPLSSFKNRTTLRRNIAAYCPEVLEGVEERLLAEALHYFPILRAPGYSAAAAEEKERGCKKEAEYALPPLGRFCEDVSFCLPYIHYYITNDVEDGGLLNVDDGAKKTNFADYNGTKKRYSRTTSPEEEGEEEDERPRPILEAVLSKDVWLNLLQEGDTLGKALTFSFWKELFHFLFFDENMRFHLGPTLKKAAVYFSAVVVGIVVMVLVSVRLCCSVEREEDEHRRQKKNR